MAFPSGTYLEFIQSIGQYIADEFLHLYAQLEGYLRVEHKENGAHAAITADSLTTTGNVTAVDGTFSGDVTVSDRFTHEGLLDQNATTDVSVSTSATTWGNGGELSSTVNLRVTSAGGLGPQLNGVLEPATSPSAPFGTVYRVFNASGVAFTVRHESALASATTARLLCPGNVDYTCPINGSFALIYDGDSSRWRLFAGDPADGLWTTVAHSAGDYTASAGNWTVDASPDHVSVAYRLIRKSMLVSFTIANTDVSATPTQLRIAIPGGLTANRRVDAVCTIVDAGATSEQGQCYVAASGTTINIEKNGAAAFTTTAADNTNVTGQIEFEVQ